MKQKRMLFIYNPRAGKERIRSNLLDLIETFSRAGYEVTAYPTHGVGDAVRAVLERSEGYEIVTVSGGDGTLDEVVCGMMESDEKLPIGYIPAGSTNDFAVSLGIPSNMKKAALVAVDGDMKRVDVGMINRAYFAYTAAFGIFTEVTWQTRQDMKNILGYAAYILEALSKFSDVRSYHIKVSSDTGESFEEDVILGLITNSRQIGGIRMIPDAHVELDDGLFEATFIKRPKNMIELSNTISGLLNQQAYEDCVIYFKASRITVESDEEIAWTRDGEYGGTHKSVDIRNLRKGLTIKVPGSC